MVGVLARVLGVVVPRTCGDGFWVHLAPKMGFGNIRIELELRKSKKEVSGVALSGGSATTPIRGRYIATQDHCGAVGGSEYSTGALLSSAVALLCSSRIPF